MKKLKLGLFLLCALFVQATLAYMDPLPSWNNGEVKRSILQFVSDVTTEHSSRFVKPEDRIATFDNDGTLWSETPTVEVVFTKERLAKLEPNIALIKEGRAALPKLSQKQILDIMARTHAGMTEDEFASQVRDFFAQAEHPKLHVPYTQTTYKPMLELLAYLKSSGFKLFICSGGDTSFMRVVANDIYGIPSENVIGSFFVDKVVEQNGKLTVMRTSTLGMINDGNGKPVGIMRQIGKRPIFSAGNERSGGDIAHLRFSSEGSLPSLQLMINHDDGIREAAYDEKGNPSLNAAAKYGWKVISMKNDWKQIFATKPNLAKQP